VSRGACLLARAGEDCPPAVITGILTLWEEANEEFDSRPGCIDGFSGPFRPSVEQWQAFRKTLDQVNVWCWEDYYPSLPDFGGGTSWDLKIAYTDKAIKSGGSNCFPLRNGKPNYVGSGRKGDATFSKFCRAVTMLVGREFK
jgi:hypothetical protein